jgi:1-pyrroline-5-carboxylate dehydrogenase
MYEKLLATLKGESGINRLKLHNLVGGKWVEGRRYRTLINPLNNLPLLIHPDTQPDEFAPFLESLAKCSKFGLHNPFKNPERYLMLAQVSFKAACALEDPEVERYFTLLVQSVMPKSYIQARGEVVVTRQFLKNFGGDQVRFLATGTTTPGDYLGQMPHHFRWPYGPVVIVAPFNFPLEIPALQLMGALFMGNKPLVKSATTVSVVIEQFIRLLHECGLPKEDVDLIHCGGAVMDKLLERGKDIIRLVQFTGSSTVAEHIAEMYRGKVKVEDAGFDWKILGPDFQPKMLRLVAWQCDQDAYAASGQKCSATSILFAHENWVSGGLFEELRDRTMSRKLSDLTIGPVLTETTERMIEHVQKLLAIPGAKLLFGGKELSGHTIPKCYGAMEPTAVYVPVSVMLEPKNFPLVTTEIFGPFQVVTTYSNEMLPLVLECCERMKNHLTAGIVSNDPVFLNHVIGLTVNGTTYAGMRARTTGAPQNHFFGPAGDPRGAGIGTPKAIIDTWSCTRMINFDYGPIDFDAPLVQS